MLDETPEPFDCATQAIDTLVRSAIFRPVDQVTDTRIAHKLDRMFAFAQCYEEL